MPMLLRHFTWPLCIALLAGVGACADFQWRDAAPVRADQPEPTSPEALESECSRLRAQIRRNQVTAQEAPSTTSTPIIADASIGKADRNIDLLQKRYDDLDCPSHPDQNQSTPASGAPAPVPAASGLP